MDGFLLNRLIKILDESMKNKMISNISFLGRSIRFSAGRKSMTFHLGGDISWIEFSESSESLEGVNLNPFQRFMKKALSRSRVKNICTINGDRVVELVFEKMNPLGLEEFHVIFEMIDGRVNAFLVKDSVILQPFKSAAGKRALEIGDRYISPEARFPSVFDSPLPASGEVRFVNVDKYLEEYLTKIRDERGMEAARRLQEEILSTEDFYICSRQGKTVISPVSYPEWTETERFHGVVEAVNGYYGGYLGRRSVKQARDKLFEYIKAKRKKTQKTLENIKGDYLKHSDYELYKSKGDLLLTYGRLVGKYDKQVSFQDLVTGEMVEISINPSISPADNAAKYYKRYTRGKKALKSIKKRRIEIENELDYYQQTEFFSEKTETLDDIKSLGRELGMPRYTKKENVKRGKKDIIKAPSVKMKECTIIYGRSAKENEYVTLKLASRNDIWMHVRNMTGTHVVIKCPDVEKTDDDILEAASQIAVYMSKARGGTKVPVDMTKVKYVKKPKGTPAGFVLYDHFTTIIVDQDYAAVERLTGRRAERK